jgi:predicted transcriptional regulator
MRKKIVNCGIMSPEDYIERAKAIARGEYKPKRGEPKIWFESLQTMAQVLNNENQRLLHTIIEEKPKSIAALSASTGRKVSNLSRTLKKMEQYGIVGLVRQKGTVKPIVRATDFKCQFGLNSYS